MPADVSTVAFRLSPAQVRRQCDADQFGFSTTAELSPAEPLTGQRRAADALEFGIAVRERGFNIYVAGAPGLGKTTAVRAHLEAAAQLRPTPSDWCYVHNFREPSRPRALQLAPGEGRRLRDGVRQVVQAARREIPRAFESEEYLARREAIINSLNRRREQGMAQLAARAQANGLLLQPTPVGIALAPLAGNRPMSEEEIAALRPEMRADIDRARQSLEADVSALFKELRAAERETRQQLEAQDRDVALNAVGGVVEDLSEQYSGQPEVGAFLQQVREGILADITLFRSHPLPADGSLPQTASGDDPQTMMRERELRKYEVNVVVDNGGTRGAPVVLEFNPIYPNLIGRIEREALMGALVTDFTLISPGALHRANGGYLIMRVEDLLRSPASWDALKRALRANAVTIEDVSEALGMTSTRGLRPDPIPLEIKVVLLGDPGIYHLLFAMDSDFRSMFKVKADFDSQMDRTPESEEDYAAFVAACVTPGCRPLTRAAIARVIEESSRAADDQRKLSLQVGMMRDLITEADHWAQVANSPLVEAEHVSRAVDEKIYRTAQIRERLQELTARGVIMIRPEGVAVGQIHGLAVLGLADQAFGRPSRITATVGAGGDGLLDIERQAELGGRIHSKGVMILGGFLTDTFAHDKPLALTARLVFEQSYDQVEGDSASLAELLALLSRLADVPLRQSIAVTGSVNQRGDVQAVGGVNEKIEGFFDTCRTMGLSGEQGVIIPAANAEHLMLRPDVVDAVASGAFQVYAVHTVDDALTILCASEDGTPIAPATVRERADARLQGLANALREYGSGQQAHTGGADGALPG